MRVVEGVDAMRAEAAEARAEGKKISFVPTMGALHDGHRALLRRARGLGGLLVMSIFVNPAQFGPGEDYEEYPRDTEGDLETARKEGVDVVFMPAPVEIYPAGFSEWVEPGPLAERLCGASRPGHFRGVATVVARLFEIVAPDVAFFGLKDYQQLLVIRRMVRELGLGVRIEGVETVREADGLAMSSRNSYLAPEERRAALCIPRALSAAREAFEAGTRSGGAIIEKMKKIIENQPGAVIEYISVSDPETLEELEDIKGRALAALAVRIGRTRLIDNALLGPGA